MAQVGETKEGNRERIVSNNYNPTDQKEGCKVYYKVSWRLLQIENSAYYITSMKALRGAKGLF